MRLREYIKQQGLTQQQMANKLGITLTHLVCIMSGRSGCSKALAKKIEEMTNGDVTRLEVLFPEEFKGNTN